MKKKILMSFIALFVFSVLAINVNARQNSMVGIDFTEAAKAPENIPSSGAELAATLTNEFDFSRVVFETSNGGTMYGASNLKKIVLGDLNIANIQADNLGLNAFNDWFTAYCLDGELKYPEFSIYSNPEFLLSYSIYNDATADETEKQEAAAEMIQMMVTAAFVNNKELSEPLLKNFKGYPIGPVVEFEFTGETTQADFTMESLKTNPTKVRSVKITAITFLDDGGNEKYVASNGAVSNDPQVLDVPLSFRATNILFDKFYTVDNLEAKYNHGLWILEHSYPTMNLTDFLNSVGVNYETLKTQIHDLQANPTNDENLQYLIENGLMEDTKVDDLTGSELEQYTENYVYGTIQYAIWKVYNGKHAADGSSLGGSIKNVSELDKIYKYLIQDRSEYSDYNTKKYNNTFTTKAPASGKEIYKQDSNGYLYGPYKVSYEALNNLDINLSTASGTDKTIKVVDKDGKEITKIANGGEFYVKVPKSTKVGQVKVDYKVDGIYTFTPEGNRGRIYYPNYVNSQNVITAGRMTTANITGQFDLTTNPKTGVENVGVLLMVTLVAFSLGYLVLSFKAKPIGLN